MRKILGVAALMLAICCPTLAGEIPNPPAPQPQSSSAPGPTTGDESATQDEADTPAAPDSFPETLPDSFVETLFDLLAVLPTLL